MTPRYFMSRTWENSIFENNNTQFYSLINPDDHDRFLVDPAYRLERQ